MSHDAQNRNQILNRNQIPRWVISICISLLAVVANAQSQDSSTLEEPKGNYRVDINIFNRYDDHRIDSSYMGNRAVFSMLDSLMLDTLIIDHTRRIDVVSSSSIEGSVPYNTALSIRRMNSIEATFRGRYSFIEPQKWNFSYMPENWFHLRGAVVDDKNVPNRDEVLSIIDMEEHHADERESMLKELDGGAPWSYIHQHILPASRGSVSMLFVPMNLSPLAASMESLPGSTLDFPTLKFPPPSKIKPYHI